jgi:hypothetical protein
VSVASSRRSLGEGNPWDRRPGEPPKAWSAFQVYRDLGSFERSFSRAVTALGRTVGYRRVLEEWSVRWSWVERSQAWDAHQDELRQRKLNEEVEQMAERHARTAQQMLEIADLKLQAVMRGISVSLQEGGDSFDVPGLTLTTLPTLVKIAAELERLSRGESTAVTELRPGDRLMLPSALPEGVFHQVVEALAAQKAMPGTRDRDPMADAKP